MQAPKRDLARDLELANEQLKQLRAETKDLETEQDESRKHYANTISAKRRLISEVTTEVSRIEQAFKIEQLREALAGEEEFKELHQAFVSAELKDHFKAWTWAEDKLTITDEDKDLDSAYHSLTRGEFRIYCEAILAILDDPTYQDKLLDVELDYGYKNPDNIVPREIRLTVRQTYGARHTVWQDRRRKFMNMFKVIPMQAQTECYVGYDHKVSMYGYRVKYPLGRSARVRVFRKPGSLARTLLATHRSEDTDLEPPPS